MHAVGDRMFAVVGGAGQNPPASRDVVNTYPITTLEQSENAELATKFVEFVTGQAGRQVLDAAGFGTP